jgi:hypothetical protein
MLATVALLASSIAASGCGGKSGGSGSSTSTTTPHKHSSKPAY